MSRAKRKPTSRRPPGATGDDPFFDACDACEFDLGGEAAVECRACGGRFCASCFGEHEACPALQARDLLDDLEREDERLTEDLDDGTEENGP